MCNNKVAYKRLVDVAHIRLGYSPAKDHEFDFSRNVGAGKSSSELSRRTLLMVAPTSIATDGSIVWSRVERIEVSHAQSAESHKLQAGSILVCLRGVLRIVLMTEHALLKTEGPHEEPLPMLASSAWAVITSKDPDVVLPEYLKFHLTSAGTLRRLADMKSGSNVQFMRLSTLQELPVEIPSPPRQRLLVKLSDLIDKQEQLEGEKTKLLRRYITSKNHADHQTVPAK